MPAKAKPFSRSIEFDRAKADKDKRIVPIAFSSEHPVDCGDYDEILDHSRDGCDLTRFEGAPLLLVHRSYDALQQVGVLEGAVIGADKILRAHARFSKSTLAEEIYQDVLEGIRKNVSVGYYRTKVISKTPLEKGREAIRFAWAPYEGSIVPVPADPTVGVGRSVDSSPQEKEENMKRNLLGNILLDPAPGPNGGGGGGAAVIDLGAERTKSVTGERARMASIEAAADALEKTFPDGKDKFREMAKKAKAEGRSSEDFNAELLAAIPGIRNATTDVAEIDLKPKDKARYSILRGIQSVIKNGSPEGLELECSQEVAKRSGMQPDGFFVPSNIEVDFRAARLGARMARDLNVTTASQGGDFVPTNLVTTIIEVLRNRMVTNRLGVQTLAGLSGNVAIPRQTGVATAYCLAEAATLTKSTQAIDQIALSPKRVGAWNNYTKQLLLQSSIDVENFIRDDLMKVLALKQDKLILEGQGAADEPTGILATSGIGSVTFGAAPTWAKIVAFETALATANADAGKMAYLTTPTVKGAWKTTPKIGTTFPIYLWPEQQMGDGSNDGIVNGYRAAASNQISGNLVAFGNWEDAIAALFGGLDIVVDPYTNATEATYRIIVNSFMDVAVRHALSFVWSADAGNQ